MLTIEIMRKKKFECDSVVVGFRIPVDYKDELREQINSLIATYCSNGLDNKAKKIQQLKQVKQSTKSIGLVGNKEEVVSSVNVVGCGCSYVGTLFVRSKGCKISRALHQFT